MPLTPKVTSGVSTITCFTKYGPAHRLATQQVGYDQKGKSAVQRRKLQQTLTILCPRWRHMSLTSYWGQQRTSLTSYPGLPDELCNSFKIRINIPNDSGYYNVRFTFERKEEGFTEDKISKNATCEA